MQKSVSVNFFLCIYLQETDVTRNRCIVCFPEQITNLYFLHTCKKDSMITINYSINDNWVFLEKNLNDFYIHRAFN